MCSFRLQPLKARSANWTEAEHTKLVELYQIHYSELAAAKYDSDTNKKRREAWERITDELNRAFPGQEPRDKEKVKKKWENLSHALNKDRRKQQLAEFAQLDPIDCEFVDEACRLGLSRYSDEFPHHQEGNAIPTESIVAAGSRDWPNSGSSSDQAGGVSPELTSGIGEPADTGMLGIEIVVKREPQVSAFQGALSWDDVPTPRNIAKASRRTGPKRARCNGAKPSPQPSPKHPRTASSSLSTFSPHQQEHDANSCEIATVSRENATVFRENATVSRENAVLASHDPMSPGATKLWPREHARLMDSVASAVALSAKPTSILPSPANVAIAGASANLADAAGANCVMSADASVSVASGTANTCDVANGTANTHSPADVEETRTTGASTSASTTGVASEEIDEEKRLRLDCLRLEKQKLQQEVDCSRLKRKTLMLKFKYWKRKVG